MALLSRAARLGTIAPRTRALRSYTDGNLLDLVTERRRCTSGESQPARRAFIKLPSLLVLTVVIVIFCGCFRWYLNHDTKKSRFSNELRLGFESPCVRQSAN